jgi:tetratricopeptide (TPR) repeat protein
VRNAHRQWIPTQFVRPGRGTHWIFAALMAIASIAPAQRAKPAFDPETKDGLLIEHILQERDPAEKLRFLEQFAAQYPSHQAVAWVYDQLQPAYFEVKEYDGAMRIGSLRLSIEPDNMEAAKIALRAAEAKKETEQIIKWSDKLWVIAAHMKQLPEAHQNQDYAEFCLYNAAMRSTDPQAKLMLLQDLEQHNPSTRAVHSFPDEYFRIYHQTGNQEKTIEMAERGLKTEPDNVDMLLVMAEFHFHKDGVKERQTALGYAMRLIDAAEKKARPEAVTEEEWAKKKAQALGTGYYISGMAASLNGGFRQADQMLRLALPHFKDNESQTAALLYHLAMANYRLAEAGNDRSRPVDALRFMRRCASIRGPYQDQALKNAAGIKAEYNLP